MNPSFKHCYPFRLATTSFIYPDSYSANVARLGALVDEIELLLFNSSQLPTKREIGELKQMALSLDITYNVHLPLDVQLGHRDATVRNRSVYMLANAIERVAPLGPTTHTLHLTFDKNDGTADVTAWQQRCVASVTQLLEHTAIASEMISVETLDFEPQWLKPMCEQLNLAVCVDVGHVILYGFDLPAVLQSFGSKISILHLHGVDNGKDHLSLDRLDAKAQEMVVSHLQNFTGSVSLEVFSEESFSHSLACLAQLMATANQTEIQP
jgi:sugar phosphate isomerase/epimerase